MLTLLMLGICLIPPFPHFIQPPSSRVDAVRGYGDYNAAAEFHSGLDFRIEAGEYVRVPYPGTENEVRWVLNNGTPDNMLIVLSVFDYDSGWAYGHLDYTGGIIPRLGFTYKSLIAPCGSHTLGRHVHLAWACPSDYDSLPGSNLPVQYGYGNPYRCLVKPGAVFDEVVFRPPVENLAGMNILPDSKDLNTEELYSMNEQGIQGAVDLMISPASAYIDSTFPEKDSCGVCCLKWRLLRQHDWSSEVWYPVNQLGWRYVFRMCANGIIPADGDYGTYYPEFQSLYTGGHFNSSNVVITNSCEQ